MKKTIILFFALVFCINTIIPAMGYSLVCVTSNGVEFPILLSSDQNSESTNSTSSEIGTSVLDGFGYTALLDIIENSGIVIWGNGIVGVASPLVPYTLVSSDSDFVAVVLDTDTKNTYSIPEFSHEYTFDGSTLIDTTVTPPNVLGYSETRDVIGSNSVSITDDGIEISGTGSTVIKLLDDYSYDRIILTGTLDAAGSNVQLMTQVTTDLMSASYGANGFTVPSSLPAVVGADSTHYATASWTSGYTYRSQSCAGPVNGYYYIATSYTPYSSASTVSATITETDNGDHTLITSLSGYSATAPGDTGTAVWQWCQMYANNGVQDGWVSGVTLTIYDTLPAYTLFDYSESFVDDYAFPLEQIYLYVEPNGGTITILCQEVTDTPKLIINDLPASIPFQISKDGWIIASGVTTSDGNITISEDDISLEGFATEGCLLYLYPDSLSYRGAYMGIVFDTVNKEIFHSNVGIDQVNVTSIFIKFPIPLDI